MNYYRSQIPSINFEGNSCLTPEGSKWRSQIALRATQLLSNFTYCWAQNEDDLKNEDELKSEDDLKKEDDLKNKDDSKIEDGLKDDDERTQNDHGLKN